MELGDWEYLNANNLSNSQASEENSRLGHELDQHQVVAQTGEDQSDVQVLTEITEECDAVPESQLQAFNEAEESEEVGFEELEFSTSTKFDEEEVEEVETAGENDLKQRNLNWRKRGIKTLSSVGIAAATLSMIIFGGCKRGHNKGLQMQIYAGDKKVCKNCVSRFLIYQFLGRS